jgi:hypothetical protein
MPPRTIAQWQAAARNFDVLIGMPDVYAPFLHLLHATNPNLTVLFYNIGPYIVTTSQNYAQISTSDPAWFAHDSKGNRIYATAISHPSGTMYLLEQSNSDWRSWETSQVTSILGQWAFDGVDVDNMGWGATHAYDDAVPIDPATNQPYTTTQWLDESVLTLNAIKAGAGKKFVMFNGLTTGIDYSTTKILATSKADGGMAEEFIREATSSLSNYPTASQWLTNLQMITDMASKGKDFFAWTKTWNTGTAAQIEAWNVFAEATYLLGRQTNSYYDFLPTTSIDRTAVAYQVEQAALGSALGAYTVSGSVYQRAFQHGTVTVNPGSHTASITVLPVVTAVSPASGQAGGGTVVTITGSGFTGATAVTFGSTAAASFTVTSDGQIVATSPAGTGTVDVTVTTPSGESDSTSSDQFTYS